MRDFPTNGAMKSEAGLAFEQAQPHQQVSLRSPHHPSAWRISERQYHAWERGLPAYIDTSAGMRREPPLIVAVGGGKGGVGKSLLSANLAVSLAQMGLKVLAVDLDVGGANLHTYFGVQTPQHTLADALQPNFRQVGGVAGLRSLLTPAGFPGLALIAGGREEHWGGLNAFDHKALKQVSDLILSARAEAGFDLVLLDLGAGTHRHTIDFFTLAHLGLVTVLPEPTSIENAYLFLKTVLFRFIENVGERSGAPENAAAIKDALLSDKAAAVGGSGPASENHRRTMGYADRLRHAARVFPGLTAQLHAALAARTIGIAVNQVRSQKDIDIGTSMELIGERYFGLPSRFLGHLNYDDAAWKSLRNRRLLMVDFPQSLLARRVGELAKAILRRLVRVS